MNYLILTNGFYGNLEWYRRQLNNFDRIICVDGGASQARALGITPDWLIGDMDSIKPADRTYMEHAGVAIKSYPEDKDYTDTQLALMLAAEEGAAKLVIWGGTGSRLDHTLSNIYSATVFLRQGIDIVFDAPDLTVYLVRDRLEVPAAVGDTVSLLALGDEAGGVTLHGFKYPLKGATLEGCWPYAVSNIVTIAHPLVIVASGVLAVFHYKTIVD